MTQNKNHRHKYVHDALVRYARILGFGDIHVKQCKTSGLLAIIAIHSIKRGPAIGGCRFAPYVSLGHAMKDALRLAYMMTLKAAACDLPHGGAKSVIIQPKIIHDRKAIFNDFGHFVHEMNGRYITAMDVGTDTHDMDAIAEYTPYVIGAAGADEIQEDPSPYTAVGVLRGIEAAVKFKLNRESLEGLHIAIQGAGKVGYYLARSLHQLGMKITVCDPNIQSLEKFKNEFQATVVSVDQIYDVDCDIFSPCALGGTINLDAIHRLKVSIIAGSANNQLAHQKYGKILHQKNILYAPDFIINSGGLIQAASIYDYRDIEMANNKINHLYEKMLDLFHRAKALNKETTEVAQLMALEKLRETHETFELME